MKTKYFSINTLQERQEIFNDYFERDLEHYFTSGISCCEQCFDEFSRDWPGTAARDEVFRNSGIEISYFLSQSRIQDAFHPEEVDFYAKKLRCPKCNAVIDGVFFIFEHNFCVDNFNLSTISELARTSPFLLLSHPFAAKVFDVVKRRAKTAAALPAKSIWYRGRMAQDIPEFATLSHFGPPPAAKVYEGRYNHAGHPMLYLASSHDTVKGEMQTSEAISVAEIEIDLPCRVLDLSMSHVVADEDDAVIQCLARSALCAARRQSDGWNRPEYVFTRFVADCARYAGFGAIRYGSVQNPDGVNVVILEPPTEFSAVARLISVKNL